MTLVLWLLILLFGHLAHDSEGCTDILVTPGASLDGSAMIGYNADSPTLFGSVYHYPAAKHPPGSTRKVYDWDSGVYLGEIPEVNETWNVIGNSNEHGLVIGESTFGGVSVLAYNQSGAIIDYGSLIYITLQRAKSAREAIWLMANLTNTYGYYSGGESFSIADRSGEVWMMEMIGRGNTYGKSGAVWVAQRIPDGMVAAHANQARITTFPRDDPDNFLYAEDVVDVAVFYGLYPKESDPLDFSFSDVYCPLDFINVRMCEARVWSIYSKLADPEGTFEKTYQNYALGKNLTNRMPLYIKPFEKLSLSDVMLLMTSHYEDTDIDPSKDVGSGLFDSPYRPRPLTWVFNNTIYHNERTIADPKTGWSFVAQIRPWMPPILSSLIWFACDDSSTAPRTPIYSVSTELSPAYSGSGLQDGIKTPLMTFDLSKAFWVQNMVSNFCYSRWSDIYPSVRRKIDAIQRDLTIKVKNADQVAFHAYQDGKVNETVRYLTRFSIQAADHVHTLWLEFYGELFVKFRDFYTIVPKKSPTGCEAREPGLSQTMKQRIVSETGDKYSVTQIGVSNVNTIRGESKPNNKGFRSSKSPIE